MKNRQSLTGFCVDYAASHPESRRAGGADKMFKAALRAGFIRCTRAAVHNIRSQKGLSKPHKVTQERARRVAAAAGAAAVTEKVAAPATAPVAAPADTSKSDRAFLNAIAQIGLERARALIGRFEKQVAAT